ncbi:DUF4143 domain-containing protein [Roseobacter sp.]|uniref:DUF4143 domain-containing protein n=1 Tax=Roseobacter sp. TaxID=1907202 RepID=UPI003990329B
MITRGGLKDIFGREINTSGLVKLAKLKRETVEQSLDILMRLSMVTTLSAWMPEERKRDIKQPKSPLVDTGIDAALRRPNEGAFDIGDSPQAFGELCYRGDAVNKWRSESGSLLQVGRIQHGVSQADMDEKQHREGCWENATTFYAFAVAE